MFLRARSQREAPVARLNQAGAFSFGEPRLLLSCLPTPDQTWAEKTWAEQTWACEAPVAIRTILCLGLNSPLPGPLPGTSM